MIARGLDINARTDFGSTALSRAASNGHIGTVEALIAKGADVNASKGAALKSAAGQGHLNVVQFLLDKGADVNAKDE
ncbi:MAG: ankyrin repeat domain-containing protein, partial [Acidobacteria bacterium]|nr:ankyrin repeat domain-containing protein [Acidobacteriota bacterium]